MTLKQLLIHPNCRFKTVTELVQEFGPNWQYGIPAIEPGEVVYIMALYGGKQIHKQLFYTHHSHKDIFSYGTTEQFTRTCHKVLLTTKSYPKFTMLGDILKPGMLVYVRYRTDVLERQLYVVPPYFRNKQGVTVRVLKVIQPSSYLTPYFFRQNPSVSKTLLDQLCVATDMRSAEEPYYFSEAYFPGRSIYHRFGEIPAFELATSLQIATSKQRKEYYTKIQQRG